MGFSGEFKRVPAARLTELLADPPAVVDELYPTDEPTDATAWFTIEKSFDGIRFLLDRLSELDAAPPVDAVPWFAPVPEHSAIGPTLSYGPACYRTQAQVREIAAALSKVSRDRARQAFAPERMMNEHVYPETWDRGEEEFEYLWEHLDALRDFYQVAARRGDGLLMWLA